MQNEFVNLPVSLHTAVSTSAMIFTRASEIQQRPKGKSELPCWLTGCGISRSKLKYHDKPAEQLVPLPLVFDSPRTRGKSLWFAELSAWCLTV